LPLTRRFTDYTPVSPCNLCGKRDGTLVEVKDRHGAPLNVTCCRACGLTYVDPLPSAAELAQFYAARYRREYKSADTPRISHVFRAGRVALERFRTVALLAQPPARVLDCGAGGGEFAYLLASRGYRVTGIEPNDGYRGFARAEYGLDLRPGTLDDNAFDASEFDLISLFHVLEHLRDPGAGLARLAGWLKPGGYLYVEVPNALTEVSSPSNLYHYAHLYYFAPGPLTRLARCAGLVPLLVDAAPSKANLTAVFRREDATASDTPEPSAHGCVVEANRRRTLRRYLLSGSTWASAAMRLWARAQERRAARAGLPARVTLDALYEREAPRTGPGAGRS
jgi:SAM-dependent methyltransferase